MQNRKSDYHNVKRIVPESPDYMEMYKVQMKDWIDSMLQGNKVPIGTMDALKVYKVIDAAYKSADLGKTINITGLN